MWLRVDLGTFEVQQKGFLAQGDSFRRLFVSPSLKGLASVRALASSEFGQAVEVDVHGRTVTFGRDYLGHHPLSYACTRRSLYVSDDVTAILQSLRGEGVEAATSVEAIALYFATGYVPHGMTPYREIVNCESTSLYCWEKGAVRKVSIFKPVEIDPAFSVAELGRAIDHEVEKAAACGDQIDVWCSGGLDSSIMAACFNRDGRKADLVTLGYGEEIHSTYGDGERKFAMQVAEALRAPLREVELSPQRFDHFHSAFIDAFNCPVIDAPPAPKFALASESRRVVITGEGGDNLFGGPKNNQILYARQQQPDAPLGWLYALAHNRYALNLEAMFKDGAALRAYVIEYFEKQFAAYPGDLVRKLFYLNTLFKPSSMIFSQAYYPAQAYGLTVRHPLAALSVYQAAFTLPDEKKYVFPSTKLALVELYGKHLPEAIVKRKKSGTLLPLMKYFNAFAPEKLDFSGLAALGCFNEEFLARVEQRDLTYSDQYLLYGLATLNHWLNRRKEVNHARDLSAQARHHRQPLAGVAV